MRSHRTRQSIEELKIGHSTMDEILISAGNKETGAFECLKYLHLCVLRKLKEITWKVVQPQIVFPNLRNLRIEGCLKLKNVNWILQLPSLSVLIILMSNIEELISYEGYSGSSSCGLREMKLRQVPKLKRISPGPLEFPYLDKLDVQGCPLLKTLPFDNRILVKNKLKVIRCDYKIWWDNLEWEEVNMKHSLAPLVQYRYSSLHSYE